MQKWKKLFIGGLIMITLTSFADGLVGENYYYFGGRYQKWGEDLISEIIGDVTSVAIGYNRVISEKVDFNLDGQYGVTSNDWSAFLIQPGITWKFSERNEGRVTPIAIAGGVIQLTDANGESDTDIGIYGGGGVEVIHNEKWFGRYTGTLALRSDNDLFFEGLWGYTMNDSWTLLTQFGFELNEADIVLGLMIARKL